MPEIKTVIIQTGYADPERGDPGACEIGYYVVNGRDLTMTDENGRPMSSRGDCRLTRIRMSSRAG